MKKQLIKEAFRLQQLAGIAPINEIGFQKEEENAGQGEVIDLTHIEGLQSLPDEVEDIIWQDQISNEDYIVNTRKKSMDFEKASEEGMDDYEELLFWYAVQEGLLTDTNLLAEILIGGAYIDSVYFYDQGDGYVVIENDYTGQFGVITKEVAEKAIQLMKTL